MKKIRRINLLKLLTLFIITAIFFTMIFSQGVAHAEETDSDFNVYAYANRYEDLQKAYGGDMAAYERHYQTNGIKEHRNAKPYPGDDIRNSKFTFVYINRVYNGVDYQAVFDPFYYLDTYPDLKAAFGDNQQLAFNHFLNNGMKEGRRGIDGFNVYAYANRYPDLQKVFGSDLSKYYKHYATNGKREKRNAAPFDGNDVRNKSLRFTYISLVNNGIDYSAGFDPVIYLETYSDLRKAFGNDQQAAFNHFVNTGIYEKRTGNGSFNVYAYANRYDDLFKAFGANLPMYYNHYAKNGIKEGRDATGTDKSFKGNNIISAVDQGNGLYKITIINPTASGTITDVKFPTWSDENGQDDVVWYQGTKNKDGSWSVTVDGSRHLNSGKFITHVYGTVNGKSVILGSTNYVNNFETTKYYGWVLRDGRYYFYDRTTGVMQKGGTACGITLNADGSAVMDQYAKEKIPVMIRAREVVEEITDPGDSLAEKQEKCYQYVISFPYLMKMYPISRFKDNYACPDAAYANNILNAYGNQDRPGGDCVSEAATLAYLFAELNFGKVTMHAATHGWLSVDGRYWDPNCAAINGRQYLNSATYQYTSIYDFEIN